MTNVTVLNCKHYIVTSTPPLQGFLKCITHDAMSARIFLESALNFNFWMQNLQIRPFFYIFCCKCWHSIFLYVFIAISAHNSAQSFIKLNSDRAKKKKKLLECLLPPRLEVAGLHDDQSPRLASKMTPCWPSIIEQSKNQITHKTSALELGVLLVLGQLVSVSPWLDNEKFLYPSDQLKRSVCYPN